MKQVESHVTTPRSQEEVYAYLADFNNQAEWRFDVVSSELHSGEHGTVGSRYHQRVKQGGKDLTSDVEVTEAEPHRRLAFRTESGPVTVSGGWTIEPEGEQVGLLTKAEGLTPLFEPWMGPALRRTALRYEAALAERLGGTAGK